MRRHDPLDPRRQSFYILAIDIAWKQCDSLLVRFLGRFAENPKTRAVFDKLPREAIEAMERDYQEDLVATLARNLRDWLLENNESAIDPDLPSAEEWSALVRTSLHEYFELFVARLEDES